jgi:DNA polymerase-3 subunit delta'
MNVIADALYTEVIGQERAVAQLRAAAVAPVHAYLLVGPAGSGKRAAARSFAASLLCAHGGCGECIDCTRASAERHPDVVVVERQGPSISADQAREIVVLAARSPVEGARKVLVLVDFHLVQQQAPILLKTIEEPPESTVFVVLAEDVPRELVTIASRCVRIDFGAVPAERIAAALEAGGADPVLAAEVARAAIGRMDRARLLLTDADFAARRDAWRTVPRRLDGSGATAAVVADELLAHVKAAEEPLVARHQAELAALEERVRVSGERGSGRRQLDERHRRERRRLRTDELRFGLATLLTVYRDALAGSGDARGCLDAITAIEAANRELLRNPNETLMLQALLVRLSATRDAVP